MSEKLVLAGAGQLNRRIAQRWLRNGSVEAMRLSTPEPALGFNQVQVDLAQSYWPDLAADILVVALASRGERTLENYRRTYLAPLQRLHESLPQWRHCPSRVLVVSSSRVYGEDAGGIIDDNSQASAGDERAEILLEMEALAQSLPTTVTIARLSGIYGPGRDWLKRRALTAEADSYADKWTNRIHIDDAAAAIVHLLQVESPRSHYIVSDCEPQTLTTMFNLFRKQEGLPLFDLSAPPQRGKRLSPMALADSGFEWQYPTAFSGGYNLD
ncbi:hypothetical protein [Reinekea blandensis]|uniref:Capsular polyglutamate biosynthesis secreted protein CapB, ATP-dependent mur ligase family n=1 Tax=Reinekea blandensis MED297 TaxID=314283 RepID=A4BIV6_9GAMM|nr:hypothetical protein [Reinekea blandensis]EAR07973.1 Capsular polyglutamate biosynthesis secreted protein CapB, ATP-dependent mur ligase family [Reinekea sp. MED297] [Reinekea blandensis MED297]